MKYRIREYGKVSLFDIGEVEVARRNGLYVVEDCAYAPGAAYRGRKTGVGIYPLPEKPLSDDSKGAWTHHFKEIYEYGNNYRISEIQATIGLVQLGKLDGFNDKRRKIAAFLDEHLDGIDGITLQKVPSHIKHVYHLYTIFYDAGKIGAPWDDFIHYLEEEKKIQITQRFFPLHVFLESRYLGHAFGECPVTEKTFFERQVNLPMNPKMTLEDAEYIVDSIKEGVKKIKR